MSARVNTVMLRVPPMRTILLVVVLLVAVAGGLYWYLTQAQETYAADEIFTVERGSIEDTLTLTGRVEADEIARVRYLAGGKLSWVGVEEGDIVEAGQALASLDQRELQKRMEKSLNTYKTVRNSFDQAEDDNEDWGAYEPEVADEMRRLIDNAQQSLENSVLDVEIQDLAVQYATIQTPIAGLVTEVNTPHANTNVSPSEVGFIVINPTTIYLSATADQAEVVELSEGMVGDIVMDSFPDADLTGTISDIGFTPKEGEVGTVYEIEISLLDPSVLGRLRMGMTGDVTFVTSQVNDVISIPAEYLQINEEGEDYVLKLEGEDLVEQPITVGLDSGALLEVSEGLQEGDRIVLERL